MVWSAGALLVLLVAWVFGPAGAGPPLYDGIGFPDEPYRYVERSLNASAPTSADGTVERGPEGFLPLTVASAEQGPQVKVEIQVGQLIASAACTRVAVDATPLSPSESAGDTWGNAYKVSLSCVAGAGGPVQVRAAADEGDAAAIQLRAPDATQPGPTLAYSVDAVTWRNLSTLRVGNDIYEAPLVGAGFYVLIHAPGGGGLFGLDPLLLLMIGVLAALVLTILAIRLSRGRALHSSDADEAEEGYEGYVEGDGGFWIRTDGVEVSKDAGPADPGSKQQLAP